MTLVIAMLASFYLAGVYLLVSALRKKPEWFEDENGNLHHITTTH